MNLRASNRAFRHLPFGLILAAAIALGLLISAERKRAFREDGRAEVAAAAEDLRVLVEHEIAENILLGRALAAAIAMNPDLDQAEFAELAALLSRNTNGIINVAAAPGLVIDYVYPYEPNQAALGLDLNRAGPLRPDVQLAIDTDTTIFSGPQDLVQGGRGFITRTPVFLPDRVTGGYRLWGIVSIVIDADALFEHANINTEFAAFDVALRHSRPPPAAGAAVFGDQGVFDADPVLRSVALPLGSWQLALMPASGWPAYGTRGLLDWAIVAIGAAFLSFVIFLFQRQSAQRDRDVAQLAEAIDTINDGFALYDRDGRLVMCNDTYRSYYAISADLFEPGTPFETIIREGVRRGQYPAAAGREEEWIAERLEAHGRANSEVEQKLADGRWLKISERRTPSGNTAGFRVDITELKHALGAAEAANRAKTDFLNNVSHELRTPLTVVLGYNAFLAHPDKLPAYKALEGRIAALDATGEAAGLLNALAENLGGYSAQIEDAGKHLLALINGILDLAAIDEDAVKLDWEQVDIAALVNETTQQFMPVADKKGIAIHPQADAGLVRADRARLRQILINLVGNAVKFTDEGRVDITAQIHQGDLTITVADTGCGIAEAHLERIFERFNQGDSSTTRSHGGTGLGLAISRGLAELHGGTIRVTSTPGIGSRFTLYIPKNNHQVAAA